MYNNLPILTIDAPEEDYLYTDPSQIANAGMGLYTAIRIYKNEIIAVFDGDIIDEAEQEKRKKAKLDAYFIVLLNGKVMDSMHTNCFAKYANDANGLTKSNFKNNAFISLDEQDRPCIVASKAIKAGEEIFCSYGENYWRDTH
jgi:SET domain-containing protein